MDTIWPQLRWKKLMEKYMLILATGAGPNIMDTVIEVMVPEVVLAIVRGESMVPEVEVAMVGGAVTVPEVEVATVGGAVMAPEVDGEEETSMVEEAGAVMVPDGSKSKYI